jgi:endonuclease YncB( thermonuclease family)
MKKALLPGLGVIIGVAIMVPLLVFVSLKSRPPEPPPPVTSAAISQHVPPPEFVGVYSAVVVNVVDGDTFDADVALPAGLTARARVRLLGVDCPEVHGKTKAAGDAATEFTKEALGGRDVILRSRELDSFGRWLAEVWTDGRHLNSMLVDAGHAVPRP